MTSQADDARTWWAEGDRSELADFVRVLILLLGDGAKWRTYVDLYLHDDAVPAVLLSAERLCAEGRSSGGSDPRAALIVDLSSPEQFEAFCTVVPWTVGAESWDENGRLCFSAVDCGQGVEFRATADQVEVVRAQFAARIVISSLEDG